MPTITISKRDLESLLKRTLTLEKLENLLPLVKGEIKTIEDDELKIELADTNRPDLLCVEGIAREIVAEPFRVRDFLQTPVKEILVAPELKSIRPYIGGFIALGVSLDEIGLQALIQAQEKLADTYGHKRKNIAIGIYNAKKIEFPVFYKAVHPENISFVPLRGEGRGEPLEFNKSLNLQEIINLHPKGKEYGYILEKASKFPFLEDKKGTPLSFPPIINSKDTGEVKLGDTDIFCEVTGTTIDQVMLAVNIIACNLKDRGGEIYPCKVKYSYTTKFGKEIITPYDFKDSIQIKKQEFENLLGTKLKTREIKENLIKTGYRTKIKNNVIKVISPPYRKDIMHKVDVIEDFAIRRGYNSFKPEKLKEFTVGKTTKLQSVIHKTRSLMVGCGFEEIVSNVLTSSTNLFSKMGLQKGNVVEVENALSESFSVLRNSIIPSLMQVEAVSSKAVYPHKIFEIGEIVIPDPAAELKTKTLINLSALISHPNSNFSELHSFLDSLSYYLGFQYKLKKISHPSFIKGRVGNIMVGAYCNTPLQNIGVLGEIHPQILENWGIKNPVTVFELSISKIFSS
ncbi:phenylalanine--tRNA ligase subunit beta [candidate division WOR-3 bacterium]|nr:phenylalanine--tRNA ligase subunit beta [candidate division WOR-3 bacterium]